jgi:hypothetical protein
MKTEIINVSPEIAKHMLLSNTINRAVRPLKWKKYSQEMKSGHWKLSHQGIAFSNNGKLLDGQHRLLAIVDSGITLPFMVTYGLDESLFSKIDVGFLRTTSEVTKIPTKDLGVIKFFATHAYGMDVSMQSESLIKIHSVFKAELEMLNIYCASNRKTISSAGVRAAAVLSSFESGSDRAFDLYRDMCLLNFDALPPVALNFVKQATSGSIVVGVASGMEKQVVTFLKACDVFNPKNKNLKVIKLREDKRNTSLDRLVRIVVTAVGGLA